MGTTEDLMETLAEREHVNTHVIEGLRHLAYEQAMNAVLSWLSIADIKEISPTLVGEPVPERTKS